MAKKPTKKQLAARAKFARIMKSGGFKKKSKTKSKSISTRRKTTKSMARRKTSRRRSFSKGVRKVSKGRSKLGGFLSKGIIGKTTSALGAGMLVGLVSDRIAPQATPFATLGAEYLTGGVTGLVAAEGLKSITGQPSILSNFIGGFGLGGQQGPTGGAL